MYLIHVNMNHIVFKNTIQYNGLDMTVKANRNCGFTTRYNLVNLFINLKPHKLIKSPILWGYLQLFSCFVNGDKTAAVHQCRKPGH